MERVKNFIKENKIFLVSMFLYLLFTLPFMITHIPWSDEAHAYIQAYFMNWDNWFDIVKYEGHPLLWYLIIMPFAKTNWHYPYPMLIVNYIICLTSILVIWKASPFNKWIKIAITFSGMFIIYFPIAARGYSLGVLLLFLIASLYKNKLNHPFLYPLLIALTLNLNMICGIGASWFGLIYFIELIKSEHPKKTKIISSLILILSTLLFIAPFVGGFGSDSTKAIDIGLANLRHFFFFPIFRILFYLGSIFYIFIKLPFHKEHTLILYTDIIMLCLFAFFYPGGPHHFIFIFVYLIIFLWIYIDSFSQAKKLPCINSKLDILSIVLILLLFLPLRSDMKDIYYGHKMQAKALANFINTSENYKNSRIFLYEREALIIPYLNKDIEIYSACNNKALNWDTFNVRNCMDLKELQPFLSDKNKNTYLFIPSNIHSKNFAKEFKIYEFPKISNEKESDNNE